MTDIAALVQGSIGHRESPPRGESPLVRKLFLLMHGAYGSLFVSKFATGEKDANGKDKGVRAAMMVWDSALTKFTPEAVETAAGRLSAAHPQFPPNLPQFETLCAAAMPRKTHAEEMGLPQLPPPQVKVTPVAVKFEAQGDGRDWARRIVARSEAGDAIKSYTLWSARVALGMEGKQSWQ